MKKYNRVDCVFCDSASPTLINSFRTYARANGAPYLKINPVKKNEIADRPILVDLLLNTDRLKINKGCDNVIFSLKNLRWDKKKANIPEDNNISNINDWWDAFNYSFIDFRRLIERGLKQCKTQ